MAQADYLSCIESCNACADACDYCMASCLKEEDVAAMARCIALDVDCAAICRLAAAAMSRSSEHATEICSLCSQICQSCADACTPHPMDHCQACANACWACAAECRRMAQA